MLRKPTWVTACSGAAAAVGSLSAGSRYQVAMTADSNTAAASASHFQGKGLRGRDGPAACSRRVVASAVDATARASASVSSSGVKAISATGIWRVRVGASSSSGSAASTGDLVLVSNGVYNSGETITPGFALSNRVLINKAITVQSVSGPENTIIFGNGRFGSNAVRCVFLTNGAALYGFTLTNGFTFSVGDNHFELSGGGAFLNHGGMISNYIITGCEAYRSAGGVCCYYGGKIFDSEIKNNITYRYDSINGKGAGVRIFRGGEINQCHIHNNIAQVFDGGGVYVNAEGLIANSLIENNEASSGGGVYLVNFSGDGPRLYNCTVVKNIGYYDAGGVRCNNGGKVSSGIYLYKLQTEDKLIQRKMLLLK